jgi:hypothetical protein
VAVKHALHAELATAEREIAEAQAAWTAATRASNEDAMEYAYGDLQEAIGCLARIVSEAGATGDGKWRGLRSKRWP